VTFEIGLVLGLLALVIVLMATEKLPVDQSTILVLVVLCLSGILTPVEALSGYLAPIILLLVGIFIISAALVRTGATEAVGRAVHRLMGSNPHGVLLGLTATIASVSAWMNNSAVTPIFIPPAIGIARRLKMSPSKFLMPVAFASLLGGTCTLIGTSTNVAASGLMQKFGMAPIGMFELTPVGIIVAVVGVFYLATVGYWLLPERAPKTLDEEYRIREFLSEIIVTPGSRYAGRSLAESGLRSELELTVLAIHREGKPHLISPGPDELLSEGDLLVVQGSAQQLARVKGAQGLEMRADLHPSAADLMSSSVRLAEFIPTPNSELLEQTLKEVNVRGRYGVTAVGLYRSGESLTDKVGKVPLQLGDVLLVQGRKDAIEKLSHLPELELLEDVTHFLFNKTKSFLAIALFAAGITAGSLGIMELSYAILLAALLVVLSGCLPWKEVHKVVYWRMVILIGGMTAFGVAMTKTGTDAYLADLVVRAFGPLGPIALLAGFFIMTCILTQPMSNASAVLVVLPVAIKSAEAAGFDPRPFAIMVTIAASCSFITPMEPSCIMVYGPGRYKFRDFMVAGTPLTLLVMIISLIMVPWLWPL
jgi:di/tricarboxylate transporter